MVNNLADIEAFVNGHLLKSEQDPDNYFCFGAKYGKGSSDENPFELAFSIETMLSNVVDKKLFHWNNRLLFS